MDRNRRETDNFFRGNPVEIAPYLATVNLSRAVGGRQLAESREAGEQDGEVGFVAVGGIVEIENLGFGGLQNLQEIGGQGGLAGATDLGTGMG